MKNFYAFFISLLFTGVNHQVNGQINAVNWGISDTNLYISKNTDYGTVHDYLTLYNYSGQDLQMRWIKYLDSDWPSWWGLSFTDPDNYYPNALSIDSADFILTDPVGFANKLIIGVDHQSYAYNATAHFKVFPVQFPDDTLWLHYNTNIAQGNATASIDENGQDFEWYFIPELQQIKFTGNLNNYKNISVFNLAGQKVIDLNIATSSNEHLLNLPDLKTGVYLLQLKNQGNQIIDSKKIVL